MRSGGSTRRGLRGAILGLVAAGAATAGPAVAGAAVNGSAGLDDPFFPKAGNGGYDVQHYDVRMRYRRDGHIAATARINALVDTDGASPARGPRLRRFNLDFRGPRIGGVRVNGERATFRRHEQELIVLPAGAVADGAPLRVRVRYAGRPRPVFDPDGSTEGWVATPGGAIALGEPQGTPAWLPCNNHPTDKASYRMRLRVPPGRTGISNGRLVRLERRAHGTTTVWRQSEPMASYLALVAIGRYRLDRGTLGPLAYVAAAERRWPRAALKRLRKRTRRAHATLRGIAGDDPFAATGGVIDFAGVGYALETQTRPYYERPPAQDLVVHEIAHAWYGNSVTPARWDEIWLNEGFATYMEWLFDERRGGTSANERFEQIYAAHGRRDVGFWNPPPADPGSPSRMFATSIYVRGAMALHALRLLIGEADFSALLERWASDHRHSNVTTADFYALAKAVADEPDARIQALLDEWLYETGRPAKP